MAQPEESTGDGGEFTINLVSNASMDVYKNNTLASFTTRLPGNGINLPIRPDGGHWEVALSEINFPSKFYNIIDGDYSMSSARTAGIPWHAKIKPGRYKSLEQIMEHIRELWLDINDKQNRKYPEYEPTYKRTNANIFKYKYHHLTNRFQILMEEEGGRLVLTSPDMLAIFGFSVQRGRDEINVTSALAKLDSGWVTGDYDPDLQRLHTALVYTDIIEHQIIGDTLAPLLRLIPITGKMKNNEMSNMESSQVSKTFNLPLQFKKVQVNSFHSIQLQMHGENGKLLPFVDAGRTSATLIFRYHKRL
jgi:hypothetical protein